MTNKKTVLITGASRGIGKAIQSALCKDFNVLCPSREDLDLCVSTSIDAYFEKHPVPIDVLINNAGINLIKKIEDISDMDVDAITNVNLFAPLSLIRHAVKHMKDCGGGKIVNISSIWGVRSKEYRTLYSMTKFGVIGMTKALARELGPYNILVNSVCPGFTATDLTMQSLSDVEITELVKEIPMKRMAEPIEIARCVKFLVSADNTYITGQAIVIDGGFTA